MVFQKISKKFNEMVTLLPFIPYNIGSFLVLYYQFHQNMLVQFFLTV